MWGPACSDPASLYLVRYVPVQLARDMLDGLKPHVLPDPADYWTVPAERPSAHEAWQRARFMQYHLERYKASDHGRRNMQENGLLLTPLEELHPAAVTFLGAV